MAGKVTIGLVSHCPCGTDSVVYPPTGSTANDSEMSTPPTPLLGYSTFTFTFTLVTTHSFMCSKHTFISVTAASDNLIFRLVSEGNRRSLRSSFDNVCGATYAQQLPRQKLWSCRSADLELSASWPANT